MGTDDTAEAISLGAQEDVDAQDDVEDKPEEDAEGAVMPSRDGEVGGNTGTPMAALHTVTVSARRLV